MLTSKLKNYPVPPGTPNGARVYLQMFDAELDIAITTPYSVRGTKIVDDPYEDLEEVDVQSASVLRSKGYVVLPPNYAKELASNGVSTQEFIYDITIELPATATVESAVVYIGAGERSFAYLPEQMRTKAAGVVITGTHGPETLNALAEQAMFCGCQGGGVELISTDAEASDDDIYNSAETSYGNVGFGGQSNSRKLYMPFSKEGSENPGLRNNIVFGEKGLPNIVFNGTNFLSLTLAKGEKIQLRTRMRFVG